MTDHVYGPITGGILPNEETWFGDGQNAPPSGDLVFGLVPAEDVPMNPELLYCPMVCLPITYYKSGNIPKY
jgi:hypothetical protein